MPKYRFVEESKDSKYSTVILLDSMKQSMVKVKHSISIKEASFIDIA